MRPRAISLPRWGNGSTRRVVSTRFNNAYRNTSTFAAFVLLAVVRGVSGVSFICMGELFWMHLHRIGLPWEGKVLGGTALGLGFAMGIGAIMGAAGISFSPDDGCRTPLLASVYLSAPLALVDFVASLIFAVNRLKVFRLDHEHFEAHRRPRPSNPGGQDDPELLEDDSFRRGYDLFLFLALAFSVFEMLMFRFGRRRLSASGYRFGGIRSRVGEGWGLTTEPLQSLLDEEDLREAEWEERGMQHEAVSQVLHREQIYEQLRRSHAEKCEKLLEQHVRGGTQNNSL